MGERILLADDSFTIQKVVSLALADEDYEIRTVSNGDMVMDTIREFKPDLILLDINLSGKNGYELCEMIKSSPLYSHIPVVLLRGTFEPYDPEKLKGLRFEDIITKPFDSAMFSSKIKEILQKRQEVEASPSSIPEGLPEQVEEELPFPAEETPFLEKVEVKPEKEKAEEQIFAGKTWESIAQDTIIGEEEVVNPFLEEEVMEEEKKGEEPFQELSEIPSDELILDVAGESIPEIPLEIGTPVEEREVTKEEEQFKSPSFKAEETPIYLTAESIEKIAKRVVAILSPDIIKEVAWEVIPELAEIIIKEELEKIKKEIVPS
ncbi:MAG: response regulator [Candidatus Aminicenantia bacterium]